MRLQWRKVFAAIRGSFPDSLQGKYEQEDILWQNEKLNHLAEKCKSEEFRLAAPIGPLQFRQLCCSCPTDSVRDDALMCCLAFLAAILLFHPLKSVGEIMSPSAKTLPIIILSMQL